MKSVWFKATTKVLECNHRPQVERNGIHVCTVYQNMPRSLYDVDNLLFAGKDEKRMREVKLCLSAEFMSLCTSGVY